MKRRKDVDVKREIVPHANVSNKAKSAQKAVSATSLNVKANSGYGSACSISTSG